MAEWEKYITEAEYNLMCDLIEDAEHELLTCVDKVRRRKLKHAISTKSLAEKFEIPEDIVNNIRRAAYTDPITTVYRVDMQATAFDKRPERPLSELSRRMISSRWDLSLALCG